MSKEYDNFIEKFENKKYVSAAAEYKRSTKKSVKKNIKSDAKTIFKTILNSVLKGSDVEDDTYLFEGEKINTKENSAFVYKFVENRKFAYIYKSKNSPDYFIMTFEIEGTSRNYSIVTFTYETKVEKTITGFNGKLGDRKFKKQATEYGNAMLENLNTQICGPAPVKTKKKKK